MALIKSSVLTGLTSGRIYFGKSGGLTPPLQFVYNLCHARWGVGGALNPQAAIAGLNAPDAVCICEAGVAARALKAGSCAIVYHEPRQILTEAALSGPYNVPQGSVAGA